jgi:hypothetical protein
MIASLQQALKHHERGWDIVTMNEKTSISKLIARFGAEPANDFHATIAAAAVHVLLATKVMIQMNLVPGLGETGDAFLRGPDPNRLGMLGQKNLGPVRVIIQEQETEPAQRSRS